MRRGDGVRMRSQRGSRVLEVALETPGPQAAGRASGIQKGDWRAGPDARQGWVREPEEAVGKGQPVT